MEIAFYLQCRVDMAEGSWPACKEVLREMAQMAQTGHGVLHRVRDLQGALADRFPSSSRALTMLKLSAGWKPLVESVVRKPLPLREFLALMERRIEHNRGQPYPRERLPLCSIRTCEGKVGNNLLVCREIFQPEQAETDVYPVSYTHLTLPTICSV